MKIHSQCKAYTQAITSSAGPALCIACVLTLMTNHYHSQTIIPAALCTQQAGSRQCHSQELLLAATTAHIEQPKPNTPSPSSAARCSCGLQQPQHT
jgi:hypothetical protein